MRDPRIAAPNDARRETLRMVKLLDALAALIERPQAVVQIGAVDEFKSHDRRVNRLFLSGKFL
jgi:hypothetical protein